MRNFVLSLVGAIAVAFVSISPASAWEPSAMNKQIDATNFLVNDNCSATLIDKDGGYLLTANHCIREQFSTVEREKVQDDGTIKTERVRIAKQGTVSQLFFNGPNEVRRVTYTFKIKANDENKDLALIQVQTKLNNSMAAPIACKAPMRGDVVYAVGNSLGVLYASVSSGIIASVNRDYRMIGVGGEAADNGLIQSTAPIAGGNSGGALYNNNGELVGVVVRGYQQESPLGLSVPLKDIRAFLKDAKDGSSKVSYVQHALDNCNN
jgi:S1-C subfamily serine protease